ncbi:MAG: acetate uptake transporter [Streptosporangiaceae bacterium]
MSIRRRWRSERSPARPSCSAGSTPERSARPHRAGAIALFLFPWTVVTLYLLIGSLRTNVALVIAFLLVEALLIPAIIGQANGDTTAIKIGGWFGVALAVEVWYIAGAEIINHQFGRTILPLGQLVRQGG